MYLLHRGHYSLSVILLNIPAFGLSERLVTWTDWVDAAALEAYTSPVSAL